MEENFSARIYSKHVDCHFQFKAYNEELTPVDDLNPAVEHQLRSVNIICFRRSTSIVFDYGKGKAEWRFEESTSEN